MTKVVGVRVPPPAPHWYNGLITYAFIPESQARPHRAAKLRRAAQSKPVVLRAPVQGRSSGRAVCPIQRRLAVPAVRDVQGGSLASEAGSASLPLLSARALTCASQRSVVRNGRIFGSSRSVRRTSSTCRHIPDRACFGTLSRFGTVDLASPLSYQRQPIACGPPAAWSVRNRESRAAEIRQEFQ